MLSLIHSKPERGFTQTFCHFFEKYKNIGNDDTIEGFMHLRKAHYMSGWDWGACLPNGGIFRPVSLIGIEKSRLDNVYIYQVHEEGKVRLCP